MIEIKVDNLVKEFEVGEPVLDGFSMQVDSGEHIGLLGANGAGKTTLFKIITGELDYDEGVVFIAPDRHVGVLSQIPVYPEEYTVLDVLDTAFDQLKALEAELEELHRKMAEQGEAGGPAGGGIDPKLADRYMRVQAAFENGGGYTREITLNKVCAGLGIEEDLRRRKFAALSGGEKTRINMARLILEDNDILLLDEPTNHLDLNAIIWLEDFLAHYKGTVIAISHDRWFLDHVVARIVEILDGRAEHYAGNYSFYVQEKQHRYEERLKQYEKEQAKIEQLQGAAAQMRVWAFMGNDKQYKRAKNMERRIERLRKTERPKTQKRMTARFSEEEFKGNEVLTVKELTKSYGGRQLFSIPELEVKGGERIALLGDNGTGKSTLLKILMKEERADSGKFRFGPTVKAAYLPQIVTFANPERNLVDTLIYETDCSAQEARNRLATFRFRGDDVFKTVDSLSGGEKSRLKLCMLMDESINLLILDEPTNHLDIDSREWIEEAIADYAGNLLFVSHDRYFIHKFCQRVWYMSEDGLFDFKGDYDAFAAWEEQQKRFAESARAMEEQARKEARAAEKAEAKAARQGAGSSGGPDGRRRRGGTKELEKKLRANEREIEKAETRLAEIDEETAAADGSDYQALQALFEEKTALEARLETLMEEWEEISEELEELK
ncbi:MAG: ABC-F family ATP-binding cassette domain-containing protein [Lachnospiraceae bacterium]|nr:ABC-F family ATP-binding cassette domain-containing protein [Lachnospiraceae bacterium]